MADQKRSIDAATLHVIDVAEKLGIQTVWDRLDAQKGQCRFGKEGLCCRNCFMGPCRVTPGGKGAQVGVCGATAETIVARNLLKNVAAGVSAHSDHGREIVHALRLAAEGKSDAYKIRSTRKLLALAAEYEIATDGRNDREIAKDLASLLLGEFGKQDGTLLNLARAPSSSGRTGSPPARCRAASIARWSRRCTPRPWAWTTTPITLS